jgi:hypothetical protein
MNELAREITILRNALRLLPEEERARAFEALGYVLASLKEIAVAVDDLDAPIQNVLAYLETAK